MSFKLLDRARSLQKQLDDEIANGPELKVNTPEYKLKQTVIMGVLTELETLKGNADDLSSEWDIDMA